jgi:tetratricopeptide (TPR) repeat protein
MLGFIMLAVAEHRFQDVVDETTRHLKGDPRNAYALALRSAAYISLSDLDHALLDLNAIIDVHKVPDSTLYTTYANRGHIYLQRGSADKAIEDLDKAIAMNPENPIAIRLRARAYLGKGEFPAAGKDIEALAKIDPKDKEVFRLRAALAGSQGDYEAAIAALTALLAIAPDDVAALGSRAEMQHKARHFDAALRDAAAALKIQPGLVDAYLLRANILRAQGKRDEALAQAAAVEAAAPDQAYAHVVAAAIYQAYKEEAEAVKAYDRAIAIKPEAYIYINRARSHPKADVAARLADLDSALKLEPDSVEALMAKGKVQAESGAFAAAIASYDTALKKAPDSPVVLVSRGIAYAQAGDEARSAEDFAAARAKMTGAEAFNTACWSKATAGIALESALADCDAGLSVAPDSSAVRDSRAFVLLRLGRLDEAITEYGRVLAKAPHMADSLYGRALAWARKGEGAKAKADAAAALEADPVVADRFADYGLALGSAD